MLEENDIKQVSIKMEKLQKDILGTLSKLNRKEISKRNLEEPESTIEDINEIGEVTIKFNQEMLLEEVFSSFE